MSASVKRVASRYAGKTAAMKTPSDLPEGWYVEISGSLSNVGIYLLDDSDNTVGSLDIHRTGNFLQINGIQARQGWGPLLYDLALEVANEFDDEGLMPDRSMVSREAQAVWGHYLNRRSDVEATPLPESVLELGGAGHVRTRLDRYESDSPLSYSYRKTTGNPFMRQLASRGQLESDDYSFSLPAARYAALGQCYSWATQFAWDKEGAVVVHGTIVGLDRSARVRPLGHAWVEWKGKVYDWQTIEAMKKPPMSISSWRRKNKAREEYRLTDEEAAICAVRSGHHGPWTEAEREFIASRG